MDPLKQIQGEPCGHETGIILTKIASSPPPFGNEKHSPRLVNRPGSGGTCSRGFTPPGCRPIQWVPPHSRKFRGKLSVWDVPQPCNGLAPLLQVDHMGSP